MVRWDVLTTRTRIVHSSTGRNYAANYNLIRHEYICVKIFLLGLESLTFSLCPVTHFNKHKTHHVDSMIRSTNANANSDTEGQEEPRVCTKLSGIIKVTRITVYSLLLVFK